MKKHSKVKILVVVMIVVFSFLYIAEPFSEQRKNEKSFREIVGYDMQMMKYNQQATDSMKYKNRKSLDYLSYFSWYDAYAFEPGTTKKEIETIIGFKDRHIPKIVEEGKAQLLFLYNKKVVANIYGDTDFSFELGEFKEKYIKFEQHVWTVFEMRLSDGVLIYRLIEYDEKAILKPLYQESTSE